MAMKINLNACSISEPQYVLYKLHGPLSRAFIERFHSSGQSPCKFIGTKETVYTQEKSSTPTESVWFTNMAAVSCCRDVM